MKGIRQAALCLHGLNEHDRKWLLNQLPSIHRNALRGMLRELNQIGVPRGQSWVPTVKKRTAGNEHDPDLSAESVQIITVIDTATINQIKKVLQYLYSSFEFKLMNVFFVVVQNIKF